MLVLNLYALLTLFPGTLTLRLSTGRLGILLGGVALEAEKGKEGDTTDGESTSVSTEGWGGVECIGRVAKDSDVHC